MSQDVEVLILSKFIRVILRDLNYYVVYKDESVSTGGKWRMIWCIIMCVQFFWGFFKSKINLMVQYILCSSIMYYVKGWVPNDAH